VAELVTAYYYLTAGPGAEGDTSIYVVEAGRRFTLKKTTVYFPSGTAYELELYLKHGPRTVAPKSGVWRGDDMRIEDEMTYTWGSEEEVILHYKNLNATSPRSAYIQLTGVLE